MISGSIDSTKIRRDRINRIRTYLAILLALALFSTPAVAQETANAGGADARSTVPVEDSGLGSSEQVAFAARMAEFEKALEIKYGARLDAMAMDRTTFETAVTAAQWLGGIVTLLVLGFAVFAGKSLHDVQKAARETAINAVDTVIREQNAEHKNLLEVFKLADRSLTNLREMERQLAGYADLLTVAKTASGFDPLQGYHAIRHEFDGRRRNSIKLFQGDTSIDLADTTSDPAFRQRAAIVFDGMLKEVAATKGTGLSKLSTVDLFNAAADASQGDLDFVALQLMEAAVELDKSVAPDLRARLIRQRLSMSRITRSEAKDEMGKVLHTAEGFNLHLVVSEAFNVGMQTADPAGMATRIATDLPEHLRDVSYSRFARARLLLMSDNAADWERAIATSRQGLVALLSESRTARWYSHSLGDLAKLLHDRPDLLELENERLEALFGKTSNPEVMMQRFGPQIVRTLLQLGVLDRYLG